MTVRIKHIVTARVLKIIEDRLDELPENLTETETYERAMEIVKGIWK